jgi:DNA (cytosine-5)-methyltransferase 1
VKRLLDLFCGAGGAAVGYNRAGFDVIGVDINEQPNYPFEFIRSDVFELDPSYLKEFDFIHASPPCQAYSWATKGHRNKGKEYPDLLGKTREFVLESGVDYIIENVVGAKLINPVKLCGTMFGLRVIRHRLFESNMWLYPPCKCNHKGTVYNGDYSMVANCQPIGKRIGGRAMTNEERKGFRDAYYAKIRVKYLNEDGTPKERYVTVAGHGGNGSARYLDWCDAMGIHWMTKHKTLTKNKYDLTQAIPPAYTLHLGNILLRRS